MPSTLRRYQSSADLSPDNGETATAPGSYIVRRNWLLTVLIDLALILPFILFICFYQLDAPSISYRDETTHIRAIQEMRDSGQWWLPTVRGNPYFNKPPFKMWLTFGALAAFGESAFSYRFLDALAGTLTCLALYFFARSVFRSRFAGVAASLALIGCNAFVFGHGVRKAVQDSMLIMLATLALMMGWLVISRLRDSERSYRTAVAGGLCIGFAALTKSVAAAQPLLIAGVFFLIDSASRRQILRAPLLVLAVVIPALFIPSLYFLPHCLFTPGACGTIFGAEVADRIGDGYHNRDQFWFYLIRLFPDRQAVGPELMVPSLLWAGAAALLRKSPLHRFLLCWGLLPIVLFTFIPSRLTWYMSLAFPGLALLAGGACAAAWDTLREPLNEWWREGARLRASSFISGLFLLLAVVSIGWNVHAVAQQIAALPARSDFDLLTAQIVHYSETHPESGRVASFNAPAFALHESTYGGMLTPLTTVAESREEFLALASDPRYSFFIAGLREFKELLPLRSVAAYKYLAPFYDRKEWMVVFTYDDSIRPEQLQPSLKRINFGTDTINSFYGLADRTTINGVNFRRMQGDEFAFPLRGDPALKEFGSAVEFNLSVATDNPLRLRMRVNADEVFLKDVSRSNFRTTTFTVPAGIWVDGTNTVSVAVERIDGLPIAERSSPLFLNWLTIRTGQTSSGNNPETEK